MTRKVAFQSHFLCSKHIGHKRAEAVEFEHIIFPISYHISYIFANHEQLIQM